MNTANFRKGNYVFLNDKELTHAVVNERLLENVNALRPIEITPQRLIEYGFVELHPEIFRLGDTTILLQDGEFILNYSHKVINIHEDQNILQDTIQIELKKPL